MIKKCKVLVCLFLLCFQFIPFSLVFAETVEDTPTNDSTTLSSKAEDVIKQTTDSSKDIPKVEKEQTEQKPLKYEDHIFLEQEQSNVSMPAVLLEEKRFEQGIFLHGKMDAGSDVQEKLRSETMISSLVLQQAVGDSDWQDHHRFTTTEEAVNLTTDGFQLDFEEGLETEGSYRYRLIADYTVNYFEGKNLVHSEEQKGSLELGTVDVSADIEEAIESAEDIVEEVAAEKPKYIPEESLESEEVQEKETVEEPEEVPISPSDFSAQDIPTLSANPQVPQLEDDYRHAFQRGMGIMPMASNNALYTRGADATSGSGGAVYEEQATSIAILEAKYISKTAVKVKFQVKWQYGRMLGLNLPSTEEINNRINGITYEINPMYGDTNWTSGNRTGDVNQLTRSSGTKVLSDFKNTRTIGTYYRSSSARHYGLAYNTSTFEISGIPVNIEESFYFSVRNLSGSSHQRYFKIRFNTPNFTDLSNVSDPTFEYINVPTGNPTYYQYTNATEMNLLKGTYAGDVFGTEATRNTGRLFIYNYNDTSEYAKFTNVPHTTTKGGTYAVSKYKITGLQPGAQYKARMYLLNWLGGESDWVRSTKDTTIVTPNTVNAITANPVLTTPTTGTNATAKFTGTYKADGKTPAHPRDVNDIRARYRKKGEGNDKWLTNTNVTKNSVTTGTKSVVFTINGLVPNTTYEVEYSVRNASNHWSHWSSIKEVTTSGVKLEVSKPELDSTKVSTPTQLFLKAGTYLGNVSTYVQGTTNHNNTGRVEIRDYNVGTYVAKTSTLKHSNYLGTTANRGKYDPYTIAGLTAGSRYQVKIGIRGWMLPTHGEYQYSTVSDFYTPNTVNAIPTSATNPDLTTPTTANNATAKFTGTYNAAGVGTTVPAHPRNVDDIGVRYRKKGETDWKTENVTKNSVNTGTKSVVFTINSLASKTTYEMQYIVRNASEVWSAWSAIKEFTTKGIGLKVNPPVFDQDSATSSTIQMKPGTYTGDISQAGNNGKVFTESYNTGSSGIKDWTEKISNLTHDTTTDGNYSGALITGLDAGTRYRGWIRLQDYEGNFMPHVESNPQYFYTTNVVNKPSVLSLGTPTTPLDATASLNGQYVVGTKTGQTPVHPTEAKVRVSLDGTNWQEISSSTQPQLTSATINTGGSSVDFSLSKLKANTKYYVQYCVKNQGGWSSWSASEEIITLSPPAGLYLLDVPQFDFNTLQKKDFNQTSSLSADSVKKPVIIDNSDTTVGWSLSAKLKPLKRTADAQVMPWATMRMDINLQNTTDGGSSWQNYTTGVIGSPGTLTLNSGDPAKVLWSINTPADAQGTFRNEIDWTSVELDVPANQEGYYQGKLVWSLDSIP